MPRRTLPPSVTSVTLAALLVGIAATPAVAEAVPVNLLRNGSFEGGLLYWHNLEPKFHSLTDDARVGRFALRIESKNPMSAPFAVPRGENFTASFWVKADRPGEVRVQLPPSAREDGQRADRLWTRGAARSVAVGPDWQRVSVTMKADVPPSGFWPDSHYLLQIEGTVPLVVDGVTVVTGSEGTTDYVPSRPVEVLVACPSLPGYDPAGNLLPRGQPVHLTAHVSNPRPTPREVTLRFHLFDYEGDRPVGEPIDRPLTLPAGGTVSETVTLPLSATGCVLARAAVYDGHEPGGGIEPHRLLDSSEVPLTSLPYPREPRPPVFAERFGGSFFGPKSAALGSTLGFAWSRWYPHTKWEDHQPNGPDDWHWFDKELDLLESLGISSHLVLYGWPKWAMTDDHPLPLDMRWSAADPRWDDLTVETAWDRYITTAVKHYRGRSVVYEIENEPEFDRWDKFQTEYVKFTIRTARLIKRADPQAVVMVDNVYGIPSGLNRTLLEGGAAPYIDVISWHDYHAGPLTDATGIRRMRGALDRLGGKHIAIWFNEGWAFTNTAVDEPPAATGLTSAQSTNAMVSSVAEMTVAGQDKTVLFHTGYETHGMSFWDYSGPGTMLWDWYGNPLPLAAAWNVLNHHIGLSERVGLARPAGANFAVFQDLRNGRGVAVAYADRGAKADITVELPASLAGLTAEDAMGNTAPLSGRMLTLSQTGRPVFLYDGQIDGNSLFTALEPLDRSHAGFANAGGTYSLPPTWDGNAAGNPALDQGRPVWRLDQVLPGNKATPPLFRPLVWRDGWWVAPSGGAGGQPKVERKDDALRLEFRARNNESPHEHLAGLTFIAPADGTYALAGTAGLKLWDGGNAVRLTVLKKTDAGIETLHTLPLKRDAAVRLTGLTVPLSAGDELTLLPRIDGMFSGGDLTLRGFTVSTGAAEAWRLPAAWEGETVGAAAGNPIRQSDGKGDGKGGGVPVWRLDQLWPTDPIMAANYRPLVWDGGRWIAADHGQGGHPSATVADGTLTTGSLGPWGGGGNDHPKVPVLAFLAPRPGVYRLTATARTKPWTGNAERFRLAVYKKDAQRAAPVASFDLPRSGEPVDLVAEVELAAGHELLLMPLMPDWNNATTTTITDLTVTREE